MSNHNKYIFWIESFDHSEDWFVVGVDNLVAEEFFCNFQGYDLDLVTSQEICVAIHEDQEDINKEAYFPSHEMLVKNGFEIISEDEPRILWRAGKKYCQGDIVKNAVLYTRGKKEGVYIVEVRDTGLFKIGVTKDIKKRLYQLQTSNPYEFYLIEFFVTDKNRKLESLLHKKFKLNRYKREWFKLNPDEVLEACQFARNFIGEPYIAIITEHIENNTTKDISIENDDLPF